MPQLWEIGVGIVAGIGQLVGVRAGTEQPPYTVVERSGPVEIRQYAPRLAAETTVRGPVVAARNEGFRRIAGYIFGGNSARGGIAMTAPVAQVRGDAQMIAMTAPVAQASAGDDAWTVQFFMPARYTRQTLPTPNDPQVRIVELPAQHYAVLRFTGSRNGAAVAARTRSLTASLSGSRWRASGEPTAWFYDPPWTVPFLRRNEVAAPVTPLEGHEAR